MTMIRAIHLCCLLPASLLAITGSGQWTYVEQDPGNLASIVGGTEELEPGRYLVPMAVWDPDLPMDHSVGVLLEIDQDGTASDVGIAWPYGSRTFGMTVIPDGGRGKHHIITIPRDSLSGDHLGVLHTVTDTDLNPVSMDLHQVVANSRFVYPAHTLTESGDVVSVFGMNTVNELSLRDKLLFLRTSNDGALVDWHLEEGTSFTVRHVEEDPDGLRVTFQTAQNFGPYGRGKVLWFDGDHALASGMAMPNANGLQYQPLQDSLLSCITSLRCADGNLLVSGGRSVLTNWTTGYQIVACLSKVSPQGELLDVFYPPPPIPGAFSRPIYHGLRRTADGNILWGYEQDDDWMVPSHVRLYSMDEDLNVLGEIYLDGSIEGIHIRPNHLAPTSDGGLLLSGSFFDLTTWLPSRGIVMKFGGFTSVEETQGGEWDIQIYPNPGTSFTVQMSGPALSNGVLDLHDTSGRLVKHIALTWNQAVVNAEMLASGMYHFRVRAGNGTLVGTGKWMRE